MSFLVGSLESGERGKQESRRFSSYLVCYSLALAIVAK